MCDIIEGKRRLYCMPARKNGFSIVKSNSREDSPLYVKISVRNEKGHSTSKLIGAIGRKSSFSSDEEIEKKAFEVYESWIKANSGNTATVVLDSEKDSDFPTVHLGRMYIAKYLRELGIIEKLGNLKGEKKAKFQFDFASIVETLIESQILCPESKRNEFYSEKGLGFNKGISLHDIYRTLDVLAAHSAEINAYSYKKIKEHDKKNTNVYYYDCTNFYYTQGSEGELLGTKKAKEGMVAPLVQMGLLIDEWGYLIGMIVFDGKSNEQPSLKQQIEQISQHISMSSIIVCTDAGLCSFKNKMFLSKDGRAYITTQPMLGKSVPSMVKDYVTLDSNFKTADGLETKIEKLKEEYKKAIESQNEAEIKRLKSITVFKDAWFELSVMKRTAKKEEGKKRKEWVEEEASLTEDDNIESKDDVQYVVTYERKCGGPDNEEPQRKNRIYSRLLVSFSLKYWSFQMAELMQKKEKIERLAKSKTKLDGLPKELRGLAKVDKATKEGEVAEVQIVSVDEEAFNEAERFAGYYVQATNLGDPAQELYITSRMRWQIEYCFRTMKTNIDARPIYLTKTNHIKGHFTIVFLALQTLRYMMYKLYAAEGNKDVVLGRAKESIVTVDNVMEELRSMKGRILPTQEGRDIVLGAQKNELNMLMAKAFGLSLTKQFLKIDALEKYSGLKIEKD